MITIELPKRKAPYRIWAVSDIHLGAKAHDHHKFYKHLERAREEGWRVLCLGDVVEAATIHSKPGQQGAMYEEAMPPKAQVEEAIRAFSRVVFDGALEGNHDTRLGKKEGRSIWDDEILPSLRNGRREWGIRANKGACRYLGYGGIVTYRVGGAETHLAVHHGRGGGVANAETNVNRMRLKWGQADAYLSGDVHKLVAGRYVEETPYGQRCIWWGRTGCYLADPAYATENLYPGANYDTGSLVLTLSTVGGVEDIEILR